MTSDFDLYCSRKDLRSLAISLMYGGVVLGNLIFGAIGDLVGIFIYFFEYFNKLYLLLYLII